MAMSNRESRYDAALLLVALLSFAWELYHVFGWMHVVTKDARTYYLPWYASLLAEGRLRGIAGAYANYTPPTLYLFSIASLIGRQLSPTVIVKLVNVPFLLAVALLAYLVGRSLEANRTRSIAVAAIASTLPEIWENSFHWGQYDVIFTTFLLAMTLALLRKKPWLGMFFFGSAIAFKLQAIFSVPALLGLALTGELPLLCFLIVPITYLVWMLPAALAGRNWIDLITVYSHQYDLYPQLSVDAPNVYLLVQRFVPASLLGFAMFSALGIALFACLWVTYRYARRPASKPPGIPFLLTLTVCQAAAAYLLPRMHERYFFSAGVCAALLLLVRSNLWVPVLLMQASALATYHAYFQTDGYFTSKVPFVFPFLCLTTAIVWMAVELRRATDRPRVNVLASTR